MQIGFIGVGNMGGPMARNLLNAGNAVMVFDVASEAVAAIVADGAVAVESPAAAVEGAEMVITMLPAGIHVREVYCGDGGVIAAAVPGTVLIDCSTIDVESAREIAAAADAAGLAMLDAPVSGGVAGASAAALTFMVGGAPEAFAKAEPVLAKMGRTIVHAGPSGNGQVAKICNNMILGISMIALCEAFTLAKSLGLEAQTLFDISSNASGSCWAMLNHLPVAGIVETAASNRNFAPGFATDMMLKDLRLAQQAANASGTATSLGAEAAALYGIFSAAGNGGLDYSAIIKMIAGK
ncbi:MAG TPA: 3-hydroxyisobutyrate dehydrogenase [Alphaproteobacteria bacterium]|jgi:3-hydroxyisobutyrate dehydrogenase|nr:3-hydroxyisobutyrate dehydrogenase [Alphaproteobacteria bacterium]